MPAMFMLAILAMCRTLAKLLPCASIHCRSRRAGPVATVPGKSPNPILRLSLAHHPGGAKSCRGGGEHIPAPAWFETG